MALAEVKIEDSPGISEIASRIRRQPQWVLSLVVSSLVHQASERWREAEDLLGVTDEVPVTAWVVRRKSDLLLPGAIPDEDITPDEPTDRASWISFATEQLTTLQSQAARHHARRPRQQLRSPAPVKGASAWALAWSWPKLKLPKVTAPRVIQPQADQVRERLARIRHRLAAAPNHGMGFDELVESSSRLDRITTLLALTQLWHTSELNLEQNHAFGPIWVRPQGIPR